MTADERMTDYTLPEGMTAEKLRAIAGMSAHQMAHDLRAWADAIDPPEPEPVVTDEMVSTYAVERWGGRHEPNDSDRRDLEAVERLGWLRDLESAADNPSSSEPWPTDEQVLAAAKALYASVKNPLPWESDKEWWIGRARTALEAVAPPPVLDQLAGASVNHVARLTKRLEMAERLLRRAHYVGFHFGGGDDAIWCIDKSWGGVHVDVTAHEAEYLWSLFGEGDGDEDRPARRPLDGPRRASDNLEGET